MYVFVSISATICAPVQLCVLYSCLYIDLDHVYPLFCVHVKYSYLFVNVLYTYHLYVNMHLLFICSRTLVVHMFVYTHVLMYTCCSYVRVHSCTHVHLLFTCLCTLMYSCTLVVHMFVYVYIRMCILFNTSVQCSHRQGLQWSEICGRLQKTGQALLKLL